MVKIFTYLIVSLFILSSCQPKNSAEPLPNTGSSSRTHVPSSLFLKQNKNINFTTCSLEKACADGLTCASLDLNSGQQTVCVNPETICEETDCSEGQCFVRETYPLQIQCER